MAEPRAAATATVLKDGRILIAGGYNGSVEQVGGTMTWQPLAEIFDPATRSLRSTAPMLVTRAEPRAAPLSDGRVIIAGGGECSLAPGYGSCINYGNSPCSSLCCAAGTAEIYEAATQHWTVTGPVLSGDKTALAAFGNEALLAGGILPLNNRELDSAYVYGPEPPPPTTSEPTVVAPASLPAPTLTHLHQSHRRWRESHGGFRAHRKPPLRTGTKFSFVLNETATVKLTFVERVHGRWTARCVIDVRQGHRRPCIRILHRGSLSVEGKAGRNSVTFDGRTSGSHRLKPGHYTLQITAANEAGQSATRHRKFTIVQG